MFRAGRIRFSEVGRPFWALVALCVLLLAWVSVGLAQSARPATLVDGLRRDLSALRLQLESVAAPPAAETQRTAALNADLGDGGAAFRHASLMTIGRAAGRRMDRLMAALAEAGDHRRASLTATLRLELVDLRRRIDELGTTTDPDAAQARAEDMRRLLAGLDRGLAALLAEELPN